MWNELSLLTHAILVRLVQRAKHLAPGSDPSAAPATCWLALLHRHSVTWVSFKLLPECCSQPSHICSYQRSGPVTRCGVGGVRLQGLFCKWVCDQTVQNQAETNHALTALSDVVCVQGISMCF